MHPLEAKVRSIRRRVRWWGILYGLARLATVVGLAGVVLGAADYWLRFQEPGLRVIVSGGFLLLVGWAGYRFVLRTLWTRYSEIDLSLHLERSFPLLSDRLASSVAFLRQTREDPTEGSISLRRQAIAQTTELTASVDFRDALDARPVARAVVWALATALTAAALVLIDPRGAQIALARLMMPLGNISWPQRTHLILVRRVERIGRGDPFELLVEEASGKLPSDLRIFYRLQRPEGIQEETEPIRRISQRTQDGQWKEVGQVRREGLLHPFWYRVTGGDDTSMPWIHVEILEPPGLESCQVRLIPPPYTGLPPETAGQWIRALVGTRVELSGRANRPLQAAVLFAEDGQEYPAQILSDRRSFQIGMDTEPFFPPEGSAQPSSEQISSAAAPESAAASKSERSGPIIRQSGRWRLRLTDMEGLEHEAADWEVRAVPDLPPSLIVESPASLTYATPSAVVPIRVKVKDDLGIRRVDLEAGLAPEAGLPGETSAPRERSTGPKEPAPRESRQWVLYEGPSQPPMRTKGFSAGGDLAQPILPIHYPWDLASWNLQAGMQIVFQIRSADYAGQTASSQPHRIVLLEPQQYIERASVQQNTLLAELAQLLQKQRMVRDQLADLNKLLAEGKPFGQRELDRLRSLELLQRQLHAQLTASPDSGLARVENLLTDLENNHLDQADLQRRLAYLHAGLLRLEKEHLSVISRKFIRAIKAVQVGLENAPSGKPSPMAPTVGEELRTVLEHQDHVICALEAWLTRFRPSVQTERLQEELNRLIREQQALAEQVRRIAQTTLTKELRELGPQELADLESAARRQGDLARHMQRLYHDMADLLQELQTIDGNSATGLAEAVRYAQQSGIPAAMQTVSQDILHNRMGQVFQSIPRILSDLRKLSDLLANRQEQKFDHWLPLLQQAEQDLFQLQEKQRKVHAALESAGQQEPSARKSLLQQAADQQAALTPEAQKLLERVEQLLVEPSAQALRIALEAMGQSERSARQGEASQAAAQAQTALQAIQQALEHLTTYRLQTHAGWIGQQLTLLRQALVALQERQEKVSKETVRLHQARKPDGTLDPHHQLLLADLAQQQQALHTQAAAWAQKTAGMAVVQMALDDLAQAMHRAAQQLAQAHTGPEVQQAQQEALSRLHLLLEALEAPNLALPLPRQTPEKTPPSESPPPRKMVSAAELKLLRLWQHTLHARTEAFHKTFGDQPPDRPDVRAQYESLRREQARLAHMVEQILRSVSSEESHP